MYFVGHSRLNLLLILPVHHPDPSLREVVGHS
jgi:hypothetical protein